MSGSQRRTSFFSERFLFFCWTRTLACSGAAVLTYLPRTCSLRAAWSRQQAVKVRFFSAKRHKSPKGLSGGRRRGPWNLDVAASISTFWFQTLAPPRLVFLQLYRWRYYHDLNGRKQKNDEKRRGTNFRRLFINHHMHYRHLLVWKAKRVPTNPFPPNNGKEKNIEYL